MIEKFISIKNIGRFRDCNSRGDVAFRKLTLVFAENGQGKTTLCAILRSLQSGQQAFISERKTLGTIDLPFVQIRLSGNTVSFENDTWSVIHPDIAIFDSVFIHDNVYAGDYVDHNHKKNLYRVIVGTQGVQLARQIEGLDGQIRDANTNIRTKAASIEIPKGMTLDAYMAWQSIDNIESEIQQKKYEIANRQRAMEKAMEIRGKDLLAKIALPEFPSNFLQIIAKQLMDVVADAESRVRQQISAHNMGHQGETWLSQGINFVANDKCPFCGQRIDVNELITAYRAHFNASYKTLKIEVEQLNQHIINAIGESILNTLQQKLSNNLTLVEFWKQFTEIVLYEFVFDDVLAKYAELRNLALVLAQRKQQSPTQCILPEPTFQAALDAVTGLSQSVDTYNSAIDTANARINEQKRLVQQGSDINAMIKELEILEFKKKRFEPAVVQACSEYQDVLNAKTVFEQQKAETREQLDQYCEQILQNYQQTINTYLDQFNTGFRITNARHLYTGGTPSSQYQILINNNTVDLGDSRTQFGIPCFKTTLSSGDRSALALAFFLAALSHDAQIGSKIVVLDDPFTSQDRFRRTCTQQLLRHLADVSEQVIVLSHDSHFLRLIWEDDTPSDIKVLQMCHTGDSTIINEWDIDAETQSIYIKDYSVLLNFYRRHQGIPLNVVRSIRPFIEGMLRAHFPGRFQPNEWLGNFIDKIRNASNTDGLSHAKADLSELEAINNYSKKYHHEQNSNADSEPLSSDELHGFVKRTLRLVGGP